MSLARIAILAALWQASAIIAPSAQERAWPSAPLRGQIPEQPPCSCRGPAGSVEVGQETCLRTSSGGRKATCVMVLNNTSWSIGEEICGSVATLMQ